MQQNVTSRAGLNLCEIGATMSLAASRPIQNEVTDRLAHVWLALKVSSMNFGSQTEKHASAPVWRKAPPRIPRRSPGLKELTSRIWCTQIIPTGNVE